MTTRYSSSTQRYGRTRKGSKSYLLSGCMRRKSHTRRVNLSGKSAYNNNSRKKQDQHRQNLASRIVEALQTPNRLAEGEAPILVGIHIAENAVYSAVANIISASEGLIGEYERVDGMTRELRDEHADANTSTRKRDVEAADRQLSMNTRAALRSVKKVFGAADGDGKQGMGDKDGDVAMEGLKPIKRSYELLKSRGYADGQEGTDG
ncbi:hypothetical protein P3342_002445 [Pyrenophora teres f. teres]|nr:hypothetical protein P3342_002445 [Pyrenophora teres f. teres]